MPSSFSESPGISTTLALRLRMNGKLTLVVRQGKQANQEFTVTGTTIIGSDSSSGIVLDDPLVCPRHARLAQDGNLWKISDLKSENGTFVNGKLVTLYPILPDSEILIGNTILNARYSESPRIDSALVRRSGEWVQLPGIIAHELKNYLQFFDAGIEQIRANSSQTHQMDSQIRSLHLAGEKMEELVRMLRTGCTEPRITRLDIVETILEQVALIEASASEMGVTLNLDLPDEPVYVMGDPAQLGGCLLNVMKNSLEACSPDDSIEVELHDQEYKILVKISDSGCGMNEETLASMWDPLFTTRSGGNGLGAFIARTVVLRHKGFIQAESEPGKGTVVSIELPRIES